MIHECKVQCHTVNPSEMELLGIKEDTGKWLPFIFDMNMIIAAKLSSDEEDSPTYNCTTIFTDSGDTFIIDTPYEEFFKKYQEYNSLYIFKDEENDEEDLEL